MVGPGIETNSNEPHLAFMQLGSIPKKYTNNSCFHWRDVEDGGKCHLPFLWHCQHRKWVGIFLVPSWHGSLWPLLPSVQKFQGSQLSWCCSQTLNGFCTPEGWCQRKSWALQAQSSPGEQSVLHDLVARKSIYLKWAYPDESEVSQRPTLSWHCTLRSEAREEIPWTIFPMIALSELGVLLEVKVCFQKCRWFHNLHKCDDQSRMEWVNGYLCAAWADSCMVWAQQRGYWDHCKMYTGSLKMWKLFQLKCIDLQKYLSKKDIQMSNRYIKECSTPLIFREMPTKGINVPNILGVTVAIIKGKKRMTVEKQGFIYFLIFHFFLFTLLVELLT